VIEIGKIWEQLGGIVVEVGPETHDHIVARTSHVPHIAAAMLVAGLRGLPEEYSGLVGKGFIDVTRIASSDPEMWTDICTNNVEEIRETLETLRRDLEEFEMYLSEGEYEKIFDFFHSTKNMRDSLNHKDSNA
jgi:prephenate dehydrogenase